MKTLRVVDHSYVTAEGEPRPATLVDCWVADDGSFTLASPAPPGFLEYFDGDCTELALRRRYANSSFVSVEEVPMETRVSINSPEPPA